jgi:hypothetical protein
MKTEVEYTEFELFQREMIGCGVIPAEAHHLKKDDEVREAAGFSTQRRRAILNTTATSERPNVTQSAREWAAAKAATL